jgi:hypothetical protein
MSERAGSVEDAEAELEAMLAELGHAPSNAGRTSSDAERSDQPQSGEPIRVSVWSRLRTEVARSDFILFSIAAYAAVLALLASQRLAPLPSETLSTIPDWASWFDLYITFPALIFLCLLPFRGLSRSGRILAVALVAIIPVYLALASYYFYYALAPLGFAMLALPLTMLVPAAVLVVILVIPMVNSAITAYILTRRPRPLRWTWPSGFLSSKPYLLGIASLSILLALVQTAIRASQDPGTPLSWVSDVGLAVAAASRDLVTGVNPYTHGLPPWGGPAGLFYGPVALILLAPFAGLPLTWAAHAGALFYGGVTAVGLWRCMKLVRPRGLGWRTAALFLALPTTSWLFESGMAIHLVAAAIIVWTLYAFFSQRMLLTGILCGLGLLALLVPGALIVPLLFAARTRPRRLQMALGFTGPVLLLFTALSFFMSPPAVGALVAGTVIGGWQTGDTLNLLLSPVANQILRIVPTVVLAVWFVYRSAKLRTLTEIFTTIAVFLLLVPFATGWYFAFFYAWQSAGALLAMAAQTALPVRAEDENARPDPSIVPSPAGHTGIPSYPGISATSGGGGERV